MNTESLKKSNPEQIRNWLSIVILMLAQTIIVLDNATLIISADSLVKELSFTLPQLQVTNAIYPMIGATFMIAGGMLGLIIGWRKQIQLGMLILILSSIWASTANNIMGFTFGARILAGIGGSLLIPAVFGYCTAFFKGKKQAIAFGLISGSIGLTGMLSPILLGGLIDQYSFRAAYTLISLFTLIVLMLSFTLEKGGKNGEVLFDIKGMVIISIALLSTITALLNINTWGFVKASSNTNLFGLSPVIFLLLLGAAAFKYFFQWESFLDRTGRNALFPAGLRQNKRVWFGMFFCAMTYALYPTMGFITVTYLQFSNEFNAQQAGIVVGLNALGMIVGSILAPTILYSRSTKAIMSYANILCFIGVVLMLIAYQQSGVTNSIYIANILFGLGCGLYAAHSPLIITSSVDQDDAEQSSGIQSTSRNLGKAIGLAIMGAVLTLAHSYSFKVNTIDSKNLSNSTQQMILSEDTIPFTHQQHLINVMEDLEIHNNEQDTIKNIAISGRLDAIRFTLCAFVILIIFSQIMTLLMPSIRDKKNYGHDLDDINNERHAL
ncbi:MFS transporter [Vibrio inusitatus NBRC 102082]|uniref:MFS transporter n=1 Tax=Vibrio inusitatus NBRC 102082 TaxID=1219070 RepID=A0A4Y3HT78_9VIBR|nr:MFS transporter [Vibrio inusitatus]GEA49514.1 MFS transporter [Vibrio inusitatus NBRC 102082]